MGMRHHLGVGEAAHLGAHLLEGVLKPGVAEGGRAVGGLNQRGQARAVVGGVAAGDQGGDGLGSQRRVVGIEAEVGEAHHLALAHRDAAGNLGEVFAKPDLDQERLGLAEPAGGLHALGIGAELAHRLDVGGEPGEAVGRALLAVERGRRQLALDHHLGPHGRGGVGQQLVHRGGRAGRGGDDVELGRLTNGGAAHDESLGDDMVGRHPKPGGLVCNGTKGGPRATGARVPGYRRVARHTPRAVSAMPASCTSVSVSPNRTYACTAATGGTR